MDEKPWEHADAVARTQRLIDEPSTPAIFEAAFECDNVRIRVDVLEQLPENRWGLREVKASTKVKDNHLDDVAVQLHVLRGTGLNIPSVELIFIDNRYVRWIVEISCFVAFRADHTQ